MKYWLLKFNHGVEIGAALAYQGHYCRTKDPKIEQIILEEISHQAVLTWVLNQEHRKSSIVIDNFFLFIGNIIGIFCILCPIWSLNFIARTMEVFAIFNYNKLAKLFPDYKQLFLYLAEIEEQHRKYFSK